MNCIMLETLTLIPSDKIEKYGILYVCQIMDNNSSMNDTKKMKYCWDYFQIFGSSYLLLIPAGISIIILALKQIIIRTNNIIERCN